MSRLDRPLVAVVLAGGTGTRLYPESRSDRPKQFGRFGADRSLLTRTVERAAGADAVVVLTAPAYAARAADHARAAVEHLGGEPCETALDPDGDEPLTVVGERSAGDERAVDDERAAGDDPVAAPPVAVGTEPAPRDTGPASLYGTAIARAWANDRFGDDPAVLVVPSDHRVGDDEAFRATTRRAARVAATKGSLVTVGVEPTRPETGYGYLAVGDERDGHAAVAAFHEKPDRETAASYLASGALWNAGLFAWTPTALTEAATATPMAPLATALAEAAGDGVRAVDAAATAAYEAVPAASIDDAVMERADDVAVVRATFAWDDLGAWDAFARFRESSGRPNPDGSGDVQVDDDGNVVVGDAEALGVDAADNVIAGDAHVSLVDVEGLAVVARDDRVLVVPTDAAQQVREVVAALRADGRF